MADRAGASRRTQVKVGLFVALALALGTAAVLLIGQRHRVFGRWAVLHARFTTVEGLRMGAPVRLAGVDVGHVSGIAFSTSPEGPMVRVDLQVAIEALDHIGSDSVARIGSMGLLGDKVVDLTIGSIASAPLHTGDEVATVPVTDINRLLERAGETMERAKVAADRAAAAMEALASPETVANLQAAMLSARSLLAAAERGPGLVHTLFYDPRQARTLMRLLERLDLLAGHLDVGVRHLDEFLGAPDAEGRALLGRVAQAARSVGDAAADLRASEVIPNLARAARDLAELTAWIKSGRGSLGAIIADPTVYDELVAVLGGVARSRVLRALVRYAISRNPDWSAGRVIDDAPPAAEP